MASRLRSLAFFLMRVYNVPPNMNEKEKVIGGILNINQFFWILAGLVFGASIFALVFTLTGVGGLALAMGGIFCLSGAPFAIYKKNGLTLYQYIIRKRKFNKKIKQLPNKRKEVKL